MDKVKKILLGIIGILAALFFVERNRRKDAESEAENAQFTSKDKLLASQEKDNHDNIQKEMDRIKRIEHEHSSKKEEDLTPDQIEDYWNSKKR